MKKQFILLLIIFFTSCKMHENIIYKFKMVRNNYTSYKYGANINTIKTIIKNNFSKKEYRNMNLCFKEDSCPYHFSIKIFKNNENINDAYLNAEPINSAIFFKESKPLIYLASFQIHMISIDSNHTIVKINTIEPQVIVGYKFGYNNNLSFRVPDFRNVEPSTVEEYEILLKIGDLLGEKGMPVIIMPDKQQYEEKKRKDF